MKNKQSTQKDILTITDEALEQLKTYCKEDAPENEVFRIFINGYG